MTGKIFTFSIFKKTVRVFHYFNHPPFCIDTHLHLLSPCNCSLPSQSQWNNHQIVISIYNGAISLQISNIAANHPQRSPARQSVTTKEKTVDRSVPKDCPPYRSNSTRTIRATGWQYSQSQIPLMWWQWHPKTSASKGTSPMEWSRSSVQSVQNSCLPEKT